MNNSHSINSSQSFTFTDDLPRFSSSIDTGLRACQFKKHRQMEVYLGNHLVAIAYLQSRQGIEAALLLEFESIHGNIKRCIIRREDLVHRGGKKIFASLLARGYCYDRKHQETILDYLSGLGCGLPEVMADEHDRITLDLNKLVFDKPHPTADIDNISF